MALNVNPTHLPEPGKVALAFKAAGADAAQLQDRARRAARLGCELALEMHTFGARDLGSLEGRQQLSDNLRRLQDEHPRLRLTVHIPPQQISVVTRTAFDAIQVEQTLGFAAQIGAEAVILHRYWNLKSPDDYSRPPTRDEATFAFNEIMVEIGRAWPQVSVLVENLGFFFYLPRSPENYCWSVLDHFFPWEILAFSDAMRDRGVLNVRPMVDLAHATLSANMFNLKRHGTPEQRRDPRLRSIVDDDLERASALQPLDFVSGVPDYLHLSDSWQLEPAPPIPHADGAVERGLTSEGLEVGAGNIPWRELAELYSRARATALWVLEVDPAAGETQADNGAQGRSAERLAGWLANASSRG